MIIIRLVILIQHLALSSIFIQYLALSSIFIQYLGLSSIFIQYLALSSIFMMNLNKLESYLNLLNNVIYNVRIFVAHFCGLPQNIDCLICALWHCRLIRKVKILNINVSLLFNKIEPASGSRGGTKVGGTGELAPPLRACLRGVQGYPFVLLYFSILCSVLLWNYPWKTYSVNLWNVLSMKSPFHKMFYLWNVPSMNFFFFMKYPIY